MELKQTPDITQYVMQHRDETLLLLRKLASIGAPTFHEEQRAAFCLEWLKEQGAKNVYIDEAGNVIFPFQCSPGRSSIAFMAHMDVVFPEKGQIQIGRAHV